MTTPKDDTPEKLKADVLAAVKLALDRSQARTSAPAKLRELVASVSLALTPEDIARIHAWLAAAGASPGDETVIRKLQALLPVGHELRAAFDELLTRLG